MKLLPQRQWFEWLTAVLIFLIPSNLFLKFAENSAYVHGLLIDYLLPKLYLSDLIILPIIALGLAQGTRYWVQGARYRVQGTGYKVLGLLVLVAILFIRQLFTSHPLSSVWYFFKLFEMILLAIILFKNSWVFSSKVVKGALMVTLIFQSLLALFQFQTQHHLAGYYLLGEPQLTRYSGLSKGVFDGVEKVLPYGTTAHPNVLGGVLILGLMAMLISLSTNTKIAIDGYWLLGLLTLGVLFLTQSLSAWLSLGVGILLVSINPARWSTTLSRICWLLAILVMIVSPFVLSTATTFRSQDLSLSRRVTLNTAATEMMIQNPVLGVGLNAFTAEVEKYGDFQEVVRFVQPVHHVGLLWLAETGLLGLGILFVGLWLLKGKFENSHWRWLLILLPIGIFDHYLLTTQTGALLLAVWIGFIQNHSQSKSGVSAERS